MSFLKTVSLATFAMSMFVGEASAKDWISKISLDGGIDITPIEVKANGSSYSTIINKNRTIELSYDVRAKNGKRISDLEISPTSEKPLFKRPLGSDWDYRFNHFEIGAGKKRNIKGDKKFSGQLSDLNWNARNPVQACNHELKKRAKNGVSRAEVMDKGFSTVVKAKFFLHAVVAKPNLAKKGKAWKKANIRWDDETAFLLKQFTVKCRAKPIIPDEEETGHTGNIQASDTPVPIEAKPSRARHPVKSRDTRKTRGR